MRDSIRRFDSYHLLRIMNRQRAQQQRFEGAEHQRIYADTQRQ
jgi:hypothetical protein